MKQGVEHHASGGAFYCLGVIGAAIYWIQNSEGFQGFIVAVLKALVWPAFVVHKLIGFLGL